MRVSLLKYLSVRARTLNVVTYITGAVCAQREEGGERCVVRRAAGEEVGEGTRRRGREREQIEWIRAQQLIGAGIYLCEH